MSWWTEHPPPSLDYPSVGGSSVCFWQEIRVIPDLVWPDSLREMCLYHTPTPTKYSTFLSAPTPTKASSAHSFDSQLQGKSRAVWSSIRCPAGLLSTGECDAHKPCITLQWNMQHSRGITRTRFFCLGEVGIGTSEPGRALSF